MFPSIKDALVIQATSFNSAPVAAGGNLFADSQPVPANKHWILHELTFHAILGSTAFDSFAPLTGIFLCPPGTPAPIRASAGFTYSLAVFAALPFRLVGDSVGTGVTNQTGASGNVLTIFPNTKNIVLPQYWFIRAHVGGQLGTAGPGINSVGILNVMYGQRDNLDCSPELTVCNSGR